MVVCLCSQTEVVGDQLSADAVTLSCGNTPASWQSNDWLCRNSHTTAASAVTLKDWLALLVSKHGQLLNFCSSKRGTPAIPVVHCPLTFANFSGFLRAFETASVESHRSDGWSLERVRLSAEVTTLQHARDVAEAAQQQPQQQQQQQQQHPDVLYLHGLQLVNAAWNTSEGCLSASAENGSTVITTLPLVKVTVTCSDTPTKHKREKDAQPVDANAEPLRMCSVPLYASVNPEIESFALTVQVPSKEKGSVWSLRGAAIVCYMHQ